MSKAGKSDAGLALTSCLLGIAVHVTVVECMDRSPPQRAHYGSIQSPAGGWGSALSLRGIVFFLSLISVTGRCLGEDGWILIG